LSSFSQYGNEWIDFDKTYHKFQVNETGIYRIPTSALSGTGMQLIGKNFQLFYKGQEIPIYVTTDNVFSTGDYIEFYGEQNDGEFDTQLFAGSNKQLQKETSLFTDNATYFLTTNIGTNKRYEETANSITNAPPKLDYFMHESYKVEKSDFHSGEPYYTAGAYSYFSTFDEGEGFTGSIIRYTYNEFDLDGDGLIDSIQDNLGFRYRVFTDNVYFDAPEKAQVSARVVGRNSSTAVNFDKHLEISLQKPGESSTVFVQDSFKKFQIKQFDFDVDLDYLNDVPDFTGNARTVVKFKAFNGVKYNFPYETKYALALLKLTYPRDFSFNNEDYFEFKLKINQTTYFEIEDFDGGSNPVLYDRTEGKKYIPVVSGDVYKFKIEPGSAIEREFVILNSSSSNSNIKEITEFTPRNFVDYDDPAYIGEYLIITHESLRDGGIDQVERYKNYRESVTGGSHNVIITHIDELYDQFSWGIEKHPMAIKNYISYAYNNAPNSSKPEYVNLIGKGVRYDKTRYNATAHDVCLVPAFGYTTTDLMLTTATTQNYLPRVAIGRIPAKTPDEVRSYLDKVLEYEAWMTDTRTCGTIQDRKWMKNAIHIAKGWGADETNTFQINLDEYKETIEKQKLGYKVIQEFQDLTGAINSNQDNNYQSSPGIKPRMEAGLSFINYVGHSAPKVNYWQFEMLHPSTYNNEGKYPFILSNSCFVGKISDFYDKTCMSEDYTLTDNRGSIGFLAAVALSSPSFLHLFAKNFVENITLDHYDQSVGKNIKNTISEIYNANDDGIRIVCNEFTLAGDPAIKMYRWTEPEFFFDNNNMVIKDMNGNIIPPTQVIDPSVTPQVQIEIQVQNFGQAPDTDLEISIGQYVSGSLIGTMKMESVPAPAYSETINITYDIQSSEGLNNLVVTLDPNNAYDEDCKEDNELMRPINVSDACAGQGLNISFVNFTDIYCADQAIATLQVQDDSGNSINISQGDLSVDGSAVAALSPSALGEGSYNLVFTYIDPSSGCPSIISEEFNVIASPEASFTVSEDAFCVEADDNISDFSVIVADDGSTPEANLDWDFDGASASPNGDGTYTLTFTEGGFYDVALSANAGDCSDSATERIDLSLAPPEVEVSCEINTSGALEFSWDPLLNYDIFTWQITINDNPAVPLAGDVGSYTFPVNIELTNVNVQSFASGVCGPGPISTYSGECVAAQCATTDLGLSVGSTTFCNNEAAVAITSTGTSATYSGTGVSGNTFDPSGLPAGDYTISLEASEGCQDLIVSVSQAPNATISGPSEICEGEVATLTAPAGFSYNWEPGNLSTQTIDVTESGEYTLTVTNNDGCPETTSATVAVTATPTIDLSANPTSVCAGQDAIAFTSNVQGGTFSGDGISADGTFDPSIGNGTYVITYEYDAGDCSATGQHSITVEDAPEVDLSENPTTACAGSSPITFTANISGGTFSGDGISADGTFDPSVGPGIYTISYAYDDGGCSASGDHTITVEEAPVVNLTENPTTACTSGSPITFTANLSGGTFSGDGISAQGTFDPSVGPGTYTFNYVYDDGGCTSTGSHTITVEEAPTVNLSTNPTTACADGSVINFTANLDGGTFSGDGITSTGTFDPSIGVGTYNIIYTYEDGGCTSTGNHTIEVSEAAVIDLSNNPIEICSDADPFQFTTNLDGGTFGGFAISDQGVFDPSVGAGTYTINYTYQDGECTSTGEHTIVVTVCALPCSSLPSLGLTAPMSELCENDDAVALSVSYPGGTFSGSAGINPISGLFSPSEAGAGTYELAYTVVDNDECTVVEYVTLVVTPNIEANITGSTILCQDQPVTLAGPNGASGYLWTPGNLTDQSISVSTPGTYTLTVSNGNCEDTQTVNVSSAAEPDLGLGQYANFEGCDTEVFSFVSSVPGGQFAINGTPFNGTIDGSQYAVGNYTLTYTVNQDNCTFDEMVEFSIVECGCAIDVELGLTLSNTVVCLTDGPVSLSANVSGIFSGSGVDNTSQTFDPSLAGAGVTTVNFFYIDDSGCEYSEEQSIQVNALPDATIAGNTSICDGGSTQLSAPDGMTYTWSTGQSDQTIEVGQSGPVSLTVTDANGCSNTSSVEVSISTNVDLGLLNNTTSFCSSDAVYNFGVTLTGGTYSGSGVNGNGDLDPSSLAPGSYGLTYQYQDGSCLYEESITFEILPAPVANITGDLTICDGGSTQLSAPDGFSSYTWSNGDTGSSIVVAQAGSYTVTVANGNCTDDYTVAVETVAGLDLGLANNQTVYCQNEGTVALSVNYSGGTFTGNGVDANGFFTTSSVNAGSQVIAYQYTNPSTGCTYSESINVTVNPAPTAVIDGATSLCAGEAATLSGPTGNNLQYAWSDGSTGQSIAVSQTGTYSLTVTNAEGCSESASVNVSIADQPELSIQASSLTVCEGGTISLTPVVTNATGQFNWSVPTGASGPVNGSNENELIISPTSDGQYTVTFQSDAGCVVTESVNITIATDQNPVAAFAASSEIVCTGESVELINNSTNSNANTWVITNTTTGEESTLNVASPVIEAITPGDYSVSLTIAGCGTTQDEVSQTLAFTVVESPNFSVIASETTICPGESITFTATDGFDYQWSGDNLSASSGSEVTASPVGSNQEFIYTVIASAGNGCEVTQFIYVNVLNSTEVLISSSATSICEPTQVTLSVVGAGDFEWSGDGLEETTGNEVTAFVTETTTYDVLLETPEGCSEYGTITINYEELNFDLETNSSITACEGDEVTLALGNFDENLTYTWSGEGLQSSNGEVVTAIIGSSDVTYKVFASDGVCEKELSVDVTVNALPEVSIEGPSSENACDGEIISLSAVGDGTSYSWTGEGLLETEGAVVSAMLNGQTTFTVTALNDDNCSITSEINILPSQAPTFELAATSQTVCAGSTIELVASGDGSNTYTWSGADLDNTDGTTVNATFNNIGTDSILVTAFNDGSCISEQVMYFTVSESAIFTVEAPTIVCAGEETVLTVSDNGAEYTWIGDGLMSNTGASVTAIITEAQEFEVISNQGTECEYSRPFSVDVFAESTNVTIFAGADTVVCEGTEVELIATGGESYEWVNNSIENSTEPEQTVTINESTLFVVESIDDNGCSNKAEVKITVSDDPDCDEEEEEEPVLEIPNVITPNGDGMNDTWKIDEFLESTRATENREVFIYNRWGQLVYNKVGYMNEWRGTFNDDGDLPDATYYYIIKLGDDDETILTGHVTILRD